MAETDPPRTSDPEDSAWLQKIRTQLDTEARDLDAQTLSRLNQARQHALQQAARKPPHRRHWLALASATSIALAVIGLPRLWPTQQVAAPTIEATAAGVEDFELLTDTENLALYSDLDFYAWLDTQDLEG